MNELIMDSLNINYIDESEYPSTTDIQNRSARAGTITWTCCMQLGQTSSMCRRRALAERSG